MKYTNKIIVVLACLGMAGSVIAANNAATLDREKCSLCHGVGGKTSSELFPQLASQPAPYLVEQLKAFRNKTRKDLNAQRFMWGVASRLSDKDIQDLASYYEKQTPAHRGEIEDKAAYQRGKEIFMKGNPKQNIPACMSCHGANGEGAGIIPRLAGQHLAYLKRQLKVFKGDQRPSAGTTMHVIVKGLSMSDIKDIATYLSAQS